jgi:hypothetical protein
MSSINVEDAEEDEDEDEEGYVNVIRVEEEKIMNGGWRTPNSSW